MVHVLGLSAAAIKTCHSCLTLLLSDVQKRLIHEQALHNNILVILTPPIPPPTSLKSKLANSVCILHYILKNPQKI